MAQDDDELIRKFRALESYLPVIGPAPTLTQPTSTRPPSWAIGGGGVALPAPPLTLTGPPPPWPIGVTITPTMREVCNWLDQHRNERDTDHYRDVHNWLAEQMGLSSDTLAPLRSSSRAPQIEGDPSPPSAPATPPPIEQAALPTEQAAERVARAVTLAVTEAPITGLKKRRPGSGNKSKLTEKETQQLQAALRAEIERNPEQNNYKNAFLQRHAVPKIMIAREVAKMDKTTVSDSVLDRYVIRPVFGRRHRPRRPE